MTPHSDPESWEDEFALLLDEDPPGALRWALAWLEEEPGSADAHHAAGFAYEALGQDQDKVREFLHVLRLDSESQTALPVADPERVVYDEAERVLGELPRVISGRLGPVAVLVVPRPDEALVGEGFDPRLLGFFDGATSEELSGPDAPPLPTRILLFSHNLAESCSDEAELRDEVRITVLHEVGHFFGLDEDDMVRLGLD